MIGLTTSERLNNVVITRRRVGNGGSLPSGRVKAGHEHGVRRLRDMIRATIQRGGYPDGHLPGETELMATHDASRATVREALVMLRTDGLIERTQGIGTHALVRTVTSKLDEAHGVVAPAMRSVFNRRMRPRVLDRSIIPAPGTVADRLRVTAGTPCLRLEYVGLLEDEPMCLATNYALFPEAERLRDSPFVTDWYALMDDAGVRFDETEFIIGCELADALTARVLGIRENAPLLSMEQTITDQNGRPFDLAFIYTRADRFRFVSRAAQERP
jgi:GntR family transcriptional regulator